MWIHTGGHVVLFVHGQTGAVSRIAGTRQAGFSGDGGRAIETYLQFPGDMAVHPWLSKVYVADTMNNCIWGIDTRTGFIHTVVGNAGAGEALPSLVAGKVSHSSRWSVRSPQATGLGIGSRNGKASPASGLADGSKINEANKIREHQNFIARRVLSFSLGGQHIY